MRRETCWTLRAKALTRMISRGYSCFAHLLRRRPEGHSLVSLVSVSSRNWCYSCGTVERVEKGEIVEIANIHAGSLDIAENMVGWQKRLGEYPTLSASLAMLLSRFPAHANAR